MMNNLRITGASYLSEDRIVVELSDGRAMALSLEKLLTLEPDEMFTEDREAHES